MLVDYYYSNICCAVLLITNCAVFAIAARSTSIIWHTKTTAFVPPTHSGRVVASSKKFLATYRCDVKLSASAASYTNLGSNTPDSKHNALQRITKSKSVDRNDYAKIKSPLDVSTSTNHTLIVEQMQNVPLGQLTRDDKRNMLILMRQLSSMNRRRDDSFSNTLRQRRHDATMVEQLLHRLVREREYLKDDDVDAEDDYDDNGRHVKEANVHNLAIKAWYNANVKGSAEKAQRILKQLTAKERQRQSSQRHQPDLYSYAYCYSTWYREAVFAEKDVGNTKASFAAMRKAESVLESMKDELMTSNDDTTTSRDMVDDVNSLLVIWSNDVNSPDLAEKFLRFVEKESNKSGCQWYNTRSYNLVINAWAKSERKDSIDRAHALLRDMEKSSKVKPDLLSYSGIISCIAKSKRSSINITRAEDVLIELVENNVTPDNVIYNQVINLHSKSGARGSAERCETLLRAMQGLANDGNDKVTPDVRTYNLVLTAWANEKGPLEAEKVLQRLEAHESIRPDSISYVTCMDSYARVGDAHNTLRVLSMMEKAFEKGNNNAKPTRRAYTSALNALAKSGRGDAGTRAETLVNAMEKRYKAGDEDLKPDTTVYNILINCHKSSASRAEKVLYKMGKRDVVSYTSVINAYSNMGGLNAAKRAQSLLDEMQKDDVEPNAQTFNSAITAWSRSGSTTAAKKAEGLLKKMEELQIKPSAEVYTSVISAWSNSFEPGAALRAEILLKVMHVMYKKGNVAMKPNTITFTAVITAWARSGEADAGERAEKLLDGMIKLYKDGEDIDVKPNVFTLTAVVDAYARAGGRDAATNANNVVRKVESLGINPSGATYNCLMKAWSTSQQQGAARIAESILRKLEDEYQEKSNENMRPTIITYTTCINAWAKSTDHGKASRAQKILKRMKEMYEAGVLDSLPNTVAYTAVLNSCATTYGDQLEKEEAFKIAYSTFKELSESKHISPNHVTYSTFLRAISKLVPEGEKKDALVSSTFRLCIRDGFVDSNALFHMRQASSPQLCSELLGGIGYNEAKDITVDDLPYSWTKNVQQRRDRKVNIK